jgi:hypothetical protein
MFRKWEEIGTHAKKKSFDRKYITTFNLSKTFSHAKTLTKASEFY